MAETRFEWVTTPVPVATAFVQATAGGQRLVVAESACPNDAQISGAWIATTDPVERHP